MIQRIQTVYLLLVILSVLAFIFVPFGIMEKDGLSTVLVVKDLWVFIAGGSLIALLAVAAIFLFGNRILQMKVVLINAVLSVVLIGMFLFGLTKHVGWENYTFGWGALLPVFILIFNMLAYGSIKSDENLVRSMDRLR